jgi:hypothetical protein
VYNYAQHPSTEVICMSYAFDDGEVQTWRPIHPFPERVANWTGQIRAHNAAFERLILKHVLGLDFKLEQFYCTATQARANCAPGSLEDVGRFAGAGMRKDHKGKALVRKFCLPPFSYDDPAELIAYCEQDVRAMRAISQSLRELSPEELSDYHVNERINDRGVKVDVDLARAAMRYAATENAEIQAHVLAITEGAVPTVRSPRMREWVLARLTPEQLELAVKDDKPSMDKTVRANLLACDDLNPDVREVVQSADDLWASSVAKFARMVYLAGPDDRVRGAFVFAGGSATGRASSYGLQVHNFTRRCAKDPEAVRQSMVRGHEIVPKHGKRTTDVLRGMLRPALVGDFTVADWSAIEARVNPWLSNHPAAESVLDTFRRGDDIYVREARAIFRTEDIDDEQRQIGKVAILACFGPQTQVLTDNGYKAIVDVSRTDKLWDGVEWVTHQGVISKGIRPTINVLGVFVTEDHLLKVKQGWADAKTVLTNPSILTQALEVGSANLPLCAQKFAKLAHQDNGWCMFSVAASGLRIGSLCTTFLKVRLRGAMSALGKRPDTIEKIFSNTLTLAPTTGTEDGCLTGYRLAKTDATTRKIADIKITANEAYIYTSLGKRIKQRFYVTSLRLMDGINRSWSWTASTLTKAMSLTISGLLPVKPIWQTSDKYLSCSDTSKNLKPVYDILNSGSRNRFTIKTDVGHLIAHNCGFGGSVGAFAAMGRAYGISLPESQARTIVDAWRRANPWAVRFWSQLEEAATVALRRPGTEVTAGRITYLSDHTHLWYMLPSGRILCYPYARFDEDGITYARASWKPRADAAEWPRARLWKGLLCENVVQATAADLLRHALRGLDGVVLHVHDEIVVEGDCDLGAVMCRAPDWAIGLPLKATVKKMTRYGK